MATLPVAGVPGVGEGAADGGSDMNGAVDARRCPLSAFSTPVGAPGVAVVVVDMGRKPEGTGHDMTDADLNCDRQREFPLSSEHFFFGEASSRPSSRRPTLPAKTRDFCLNGG